VERPVFERVTRSIVAERQKSYRTEGTYY